MEHTPSAALPAPIELEKIVRTSAPVALFERNSPYVRETVLADGARELTLSPSPLQFRAEDGSWQPIDPRFVVMNGGFASLSNTLQIRAAANRAAMQIDLHNAGVGWEPLSLAIDQTAIAQPLTTTRLADGVLSDDGLTLTYPDGWTRPGISDEIVAGAGEVEHNVVLARLPLPAIRAAGSDEKVASENPSQLVLRALLSLPNAVLHADGKLQTSAFETDGEIQVRDMESNRVLLTIAPASVYERARPDVSIAARYRIEPRDARSWLVEMSTPLDWWLDAQRQYPVVWDPAFLTQRGSLDVAEIAGPALPLPWSSGCLDYDGGAMVGLGRNGTCGERRALVRFKNLAPDLFPPGAELERAWLVIGTRGGQVSNNSIWRRDGYLYSNVLDVTSNWSGTHVAWPGPSAGATLCSSNLVGFSLDQDRGPYICRIQDGSSGVVSNWVNGGANNGLMIAMRDPGCNPAYTGCDLALIPRASNWSRTSQGDLRGTGFALVIQYHGPMLPSNEPFGYEPPLFRPPATSPGAMYLESDHDYQLPPSNGSPWTAVAVKAFTNRIVFQNVTLDGQFSYPAWAQAGYVTTANMPTSGLAPAGSPNPYAFVFPISACQGLSCYLRSDGNGTNDGSNFVMLRGDTTGRSARIGAIKSDPALKQYVVEAAQSAPVPLPAMDYDAGIKYTHSFTISSRHVITAFDVDLPANAWARIAISTSVAGLAVPSAYATARLFPPASGAAFAKTQTDQITSKFGFAERAINTFISTAGNYGLAVELPGDATAFDVCSGRKCLPNQDITPTERILSVDLAFQLCPANSIPTDTGCSIVKIPNWGEGGNWIVIGNFRVYSPDGFDCNLTNPWNTCKRKTSDCYPEWCSRRFGADGKEYATIITWGTDVSRVVAVAGGAGEQYPVRSNYTLQFLEGYGEFQLTKTGAPGDPANLWPRFSLWQNWNGASAKPATTNDLITNQYNCNLLCTSFALSEQDMVRSSNLVLGINMRNGGGYTQHAEYSADIIRPVSTISGAQNQTLRLHWNVKAEGYQGKEGYPNGDDPDVSALPLNTTDPAPVASMLYRFSGTWAADYNPAAGYIDRFRNDNGKIQHVVKLGGAWTYVDLVILPFGQKPGDSGGELCALGYCADIRASTDTWAAPKRQWRMPDVKINQLPPQTVILSRPGALQVFSADHPNSTTAPDDANIGFSFETFGANVSIKEMACPDSPNPQVVTVIQGNTQVAMPGMGPSPNGGTIEATFTLCESALHEVSLTFRIPPGIPVGQPPPMWIDMLGGKVTLNPDYARIQVFVGFYVGAPPPEAPAQPFKGVGTVTIDTRGLFDLQATGRVYGMMDADAHLWVAWNPLDLGIGASGYVPNKDDWVLHGFWYGHAWIGRGWQSKYAWLPDNNDFHMTASYQAEFKIKEGALIDEWPLVIPPDDIVIGVELSFGQFCANDACSKFEWGIKGKVRVFGYNAGAYISIDCLRQNPAVAAGAAVFPPVILACTSFILGSDSHILIDQYGGGGPPFPLYLSSQQAGTGERIRTSRINGRDTVVNRRAASQPFAVSSDEALPEITAATDSFLLAFGWARGEPHIALVQPDNTEINAANAASFGISATVTSQQVIFGVTAPMPGVWLARITNSTPTDDYHLAFFANKAAPQLEFTAPVATDIVTATTDGTTPDYYHITWMPPANADQLRLNLYYSATNAGALTDTQQYGGVIVENLDPALGDYAWDLAFLGSGDYAVYATLQDKAGAQVSVTGTQQYVGIPVSVAPGLVRYVDKTAPPPTNAAQITRVAAEDGARLCWPVSAASDLAEYRISYVVRDSVYTTGRRIFERILPTVGYQGDGSAMQCARLGGLIAGESQVVFTDYAADGISIADASGNVSAPAKPSNFTAPGGGGPSLAAPVLTGTVNTSDASVTLTWPITSGYRWDLFYAREAFAGVVQTGTGALEGDSPISIDDLSFTGDYVLTGLPTGYWHSFALRAYSINPTAPPSLLSNHVWLLVTSGVDANGNGCADDWEAAHGSPNLNADPDGDGLTTGHECAIGTNPYRRDTDGDSWSDGEEVYYGTDPLDPSSYPNITDPDVTPPEPLPSLVVSPTVMSFLAFTQSPDPSPQMADVINVGGGVLTPSVASSTPWLNVSLVGNQIRASVSKTGLTWGNYTGVITVTAQPGNTQANPQTIRVRLRVMAGQSPWEIKVYLPLVMR